MIDYEIHQNILTLDDLNLESSKSALSAKNLEKIAALNVLQVKERAYFQRDMASILRNFLGFCLSEHNVYLILLEPYPQMKNRIRSKKGLFYNYKDQFKKTALFETENEVSPEETLFGGIIRLNQKNIDHTLSMLKDLPFAFGLIAPKRTRTFKPNRKDFLETIITKGLKPGEIYWKNWLKIAALLAKPGRKFFTLQDLNDTEQLRVFYHRDDAEWEDQLKTFMTHALQPAPILQN